MALQIQNAKVLELLMNGVTQLLTHYWKRTKKIEGGYGKVPIDDSWSLSLHTCLNVEDTLSEILYEPELLNPTRLSVVQCKGFYEG